jgi:hypothetical protein
VQSWQGEKGVNVTNLDPRDGLLYSADNPDQYTKSHD